jgi:hypothetical protein
MTTINDLCVTNSFSPDDKLPMWSNANGVTRALPISVLTSQFLTQDSIAALAASPAVETFTSGINFTPGFTASLTLANQYLSTANIAVYFDAAYQGPDQYTLVGTTLAFISPIPVGVQHVYVKGGATRITGAPSDGTVNDAKIAPGSKLFNRINDWIDIRDYGAVPGTDSTTAIVAAVNAAAAQGGGFVGIPCGTFNISSTITLPNGVSLVGQSVAHAFGEINSLAVSALAWTGTAGGTMVVTAAKWAGKIDGIVFEGNWIAGICLQLVSAGGSMLSNLTIQHSTSIGLMMSTDGVHPSGLNTIINVMIHDHLAVGCELFGTTSSPVTLNTFIGCRFAAIGQSLRLAQSCDTNYFYGGRVECGPNYGLVINDSDNMSDSVAFYGVTFDGTPGQGISMTVIKPAVDDMNTVALFHMCHFTGTIPFNSAPFPQGIVKVVDCPNFGGAYYGVPGNYAPTQAITPTGSPYTYTNSDPFAEDVIISGGTVSQISVVRAGSSTLTGLTSGNFHLQPGDGLTVTYSVAPGSFFKIPQ